MRNAVGIVTSVDWHNFGSVLQAFALQRKLQELGSNAYLLVKRYIDRDIPSYIISLGTIIGAYQIWERINHRERPYWQMRKWITRNLNELNVWFPFQLRILNWCMDFFVAGSDQIWNSSSGFNEWYFLCFVTCKKRYSYATSTGIAGINPKYAEQIKLALLKFSRISVRERHGVDVLSELTGRSDIRHMIDPVFLLTRAEWENKVAAAKLRVPESSKYILCYLLKDSKSYDQIINDISRRLGMSVYLVEANDNTELEILGVQKISHIDPFEFVKLVANASFVCTNSFHGTVFSILFEKQFVEFMRFSETDEENQNPRVTDLLDLLGLEGRVYNNGNWMDPIDYNKVRAVLEQKRREACQYLGGLVCGSD